MITPSCSDCLIKYQLKSLWLLHLICIYFPWPSLHPNPHLWTTSMSYENRGKYNKIEVNPFYYLPSDLVVLGVSKGVEKVKECIYIHLYTYVL